MLTSITASSSWRYPVIAGKQASEIIWTALRVNNWEFSLISSPIRWVEGHISHSSRVLRRFHIEQSLCSCEFGCRSFIKHTPWASIWPDFAEHFTLRFCIWDKTFWQTCQIRPAELFQCVSNYKLWTLLVCRLWWFEIFDSFCFVQPVRLFEPSYQGFWLAYCSVLEYKNVKNIKNI